MNQDADHHGGHGRGHLARGFLQTRPAFSFPGLIQLFNPVDAAFDKHVFPVRSPGYEGLDRPPVDLQLNVVVIDGLEADRVLRFADPDPDPIRIFTRQPLQRFGLVSDF